jgi:hypothetical protein
MSLQPINNTVPLEVGDEFLVSNINEDLAGQIDVCRQFAHLMETTCCSNDEIDFDKVHTTTVSLIYLIAEKVYKCFGEIYNINVTKDGSDADADAFSISLNIKNSSLIIDDIPNSYKPDTVSLKELLSTIDLKEAE